MHIVVAGEDEVALRVAEALMHRHDVVYIGQQAEHAARLDRLDVQVVEGTCTQTEVLRDAQVARADFFIAATSSDESNIVACLAAQHLGAKHTICFLRAHGFELLDSDEMSLAESAGIDAVVRPAEHLAREIIGIVTTPGALDARSFHRGRVQLLKAVVEEGSAAAGSTLGELRLKVRVVMMQRDEGFLVPHGETRLQAGDRVTVVGRPRDVRRLRTKYLCAPGGGHEARRALIVGGGAVGVYVAEGLTEAGWQVKVIEYDRARCERISATLRCLVLHGDGSDLELLEEERIETVSALVAVTNNDEKNLLVSLLAKHLGVPRIITRADRLVNERIFEKVGIDVVLSARGAAIRSTVRDIVEADREHIADLEHGDVEVLELELPADFSPRALRAVKPDAVAALGAILRGRKTIIPDGDTKLLPGDHVIVVCKREHEERTRRFLMNPKRVDGKRGA